MKALSKREGESREQECVQAREASRQSDAHAVHLETPAGTARAAFLDSCVFRKRCAVLFVPHHSGDKNVKF